MTSLEDFSILKTSITLADHGRLVCQGREYGVFDKGGELRFVYGLIDNIITAES